MMQKTTENEKLYILYLISGGIGNGGTEAVVLNYFRNIDRSECQIDFVFHAHEKDYVDHPVYNELLKCGSRVFFVTPRGESLHENLNQLEKIMTENHYDIVHAHGDCANGIMLKVARKCGVKVRISHSHNTGIQLKITGLKSLLHKAYLQYGKYVTRKEATHYFACSTLAGQWLYGKRAINAGRVTLVNNAIDTEKYVYNEQARGKHRKSLGIDEDTFLWGNVGRLASMKNHQYLIELFYKYCEEHPDEKNALLIVGDGELNDVLSKKIEETEDAFSKQLEAVSRKDSADDKAIKATPRVILYGAADNVPELLSAMDVFVMPSLFEGLPVILVEAQAAGLPCVISEKSRIASDVEISDMIIRATVGKYETWCEGIESAKALCKKQDRVQGKEQVVKSGFDIKAESKKLLELYKSLNE